MSRPAAVVLPLLLCSALVGCSAPRERVIDASATRVFLVAP
jgi:hypothetical protein